MLLKISSIYECEKCHARYEVEQGDELPAYCKHCDEEFDETDIHERVKDFISWEILSLSYSLKTYGRETNPEWEKRLEIFEYLRDVLTEWSANNDK